MGRENLKPLEELRSLDQQIESVQELGGLKPIFFRLEEIAKANVNDFDVQLAVGDIKQHLVNRGTKLKDVKDTKAAPVPAAPIAAPAPPPPPPPPPVPPPVNVARPPVPAAAPPAPPPVPPPPPPPAPLATPPAPIATPQAPVATPPAVPIVTMPMKLPDLQPQGPWATTENAAPPAPPPAAAAPPLPARPVPVPTPAVTKAAVKPPAKPVSKSPAPPTNWQRSLLIGVAAGILLLVAIVAVMVHKRRQRVAAANAAIQVQIATTPPGASVRVNGEAQCTSDCSVSLAPGNYQITAFLDGYEPAASGIAVAAGQPATITLRLEPQAQSLRIITDLDQGKVALDDDPPVDLQEGQFILDRVLAGPHTVKVTGKSGEASFSFEITDAKQPTITSAVTARNLDAILVASMANQAHLLTSAGSMVLAVNGQPEADTNAAGVDLKSFQAGVDELVIGEGKDQHSVKENFGPAPMLTAFLKSDLNAGTLVVSTGEDDVRVFLNNKEYPRHTQRGQIRISTIGPVAVRVAKDGFDAPPALSAEIKKGAETRMEFKLRALPRFANLQVNGGMPGAAVSIDLRDAGTIGADGALNVGSISPGDHTVEIRRDGYVGHRLTRTFKAGETVTISGGDAVLTANPPQPAAPAATAKKVEPPPQPPKEAAPAPPQAGTMADWVDPSAWKMEGGVWLHKGAGLVPYKLTPKGVFTFTVQLVKGGGFLRSGHIRWVVNYKDAKNYAVYEMDNKNFWARVVVNGSKPLERTHTQLKDLEKQKSFTIQIDVTPEHVVHKMFSGGDWINLDSWAETGRNFSEGKFGFLLQGSEELSLSDFKFDPK